MAQPLILVVDDDAAVRALLRNLFEEGGFAVAEAGDMASCLEVVKTRAPQLVTLDLQLGSDEGLEVAKAIRAVSPVPIVMVTARGDVVDRVVGLELGADDYITKPFHVREVLARVRSVLRRSAEAAPQPGASDDAFRFDGMTAVPQRFELVDREGREVSLTSGEFRLLTAFLKNPKRVMSRDRLMDLVNGSDWSPLDRTIDNQVSRLRRKIERDPRNPDLIKTVRGVGYVLATDVRRDQASPRSA